MSAQVDGICYGTAQAAANALCARVTGGVSGSGVAQCQWAAGEESTGMLGVGVAFVSASGTSTPVEMWQAAVACEPGAGFNFPSSADTAAAWTWGFTLVVGCYLIGWAAGAVVDFIKKG